MNSSAKNLLLEKARSLLLDAVGCMSCPIAPQLSEKLEKAGFVTDENGYILNLAVQDDGLARNGTLLTEEEIKAIPAMLQSLIPDHEL